ncbi:hypothetical protein AA309_11145 [Microvirga vignae]|uniref:Uncharacterized protein n=1 Tax=Microvirga vignae TaxID=1225564 RepID=A0A0H1RDY4_9HYPH|nr:hypothetical protein AA309_11145 [Microvirga vignae]
MTAHSGVLWVQAAMRIRPPADMTESRWQTDGDLMATKGQFGRPVNLTRSSKRRYEAWIEAIALGVT